MTAPAPIAMPWRAWAKNNSLGVNFTWRAISAGRLKVRRVGKRMLVLDEDGRAFLQTLPEGPAAMPANLKRPRRSAEAKGQKRGGRVTNAQRNKWPVSGRPPPRRAGDSLPIEPPTKALANEFIAKRPVSARSPA